MKGRTVKVVLITLVIILLAGYFILRQNIYNNMFINLVKQTEQYINSENWNEALKNSYRLDNEWKRIKHILMINFGEAEISTMEEHLNLLISGTLEQDKVTALSSVLYLEDTWTNANKFVPQP